MSNLISSVTVQRALKAAMVAGVSLYFGLVALGNVTAYDINYQFVRHVLSMDTVDPDNPLKWRAITSPVLWQVAYASIIAYEMAATVLTAMGAWRLLRASTEEQIASGRRFACNAIVFGLGLWMIGFITIGGEWFQMWQSQTWNGLNPAMRNFVVQGVVMLYVNQSEHA